MIRRAAHLAAVVSLLALIAAAPPSPDTRPNAYAAAWALTISGPGTGSARLAPVSAQTGAAAQAAAAPLVLAGFSPKRVAATSASPHAAASQIDWVDPTSSMTLKGGFAEAHAVVDAASAKAGLSGAAGSGFAVADELFTEEQQTQLLTTWAETMTAVFAPINEQLGKLAPVLALAGLAVPELKPPPPEGFIDVADLNQVTSTVDVTSGLGIASSRAETSIATIKLLFGFIELRDVETRAVSEMVAGAETRSATATIGSIRIAGVEVVVDHDGFRVAGGNMLTRAALQPAIDLLVERLAENGITLRVAQARSDGMLREASAFEVSVPMPSGMFSISVGHAEAAAPFVEPVSEPVPSPPGPVPPAPDAAPGRAPPTLAAPPPVIEGAPPVAIAPETFRPTWRPSPAVARALRTTYLLLFVGALLGALLLPMIGRPAVARPRAATRGGRR